MLGVALALVIVVVAYFVYRFKRSQNPTSQVGGSYAFSKAADADTKLKDAQGKIAALKDSDKVKQDAAASLKSDALNVHAGFDKAHKALDEVNAILG